MSYESLCRSDHLTGLNGESRRPSLDTWTSLTMLAERTRRIRFGPMVSPITFYHPAMLTKMAVSLDTLSDGRMDLGIGAAAGTSTSTRCSASPCPAQGAAGSPRGGRPLHPRPRRRQPVTLEQPYYPL